MGLRDFFKPRQNTFLKILTEHARITSEGMVALDAYMAGDCEACGKRISRLEKEADEQRRILIDELNRTFVTPIDREDLFALSRAADDVIDYAHTTVYEMTVLELKPNERLREFAGVLNKAAEEIYLAVQNLQERPSLALAHAVRAKELENRAEHVYRQGVVDLFHGPEDVKHIFYMLKMREVYRHLSNAADRGDEAANIISDIVVKMT
jgi:predicted phosphate transport protein (TIGR00153 family)